MIRKLALAAAATVVAMVALPAAAQTGPWKVVLAVPDIVVFAGNASGPETARDIHIFIMLPIEVGGADNSVNRWTVDCKARTALDHGGISYLGLKKSGELESLTPDGPQPFGEGLTSLVGEYVCDGNRMSADNSVLADTNAARAYGKSKFTK